MHYAAYFTVCNIIGIIDVIKVIKSVAHLDVLYTFHYSPVLY